VVSFGLEAREARWFIDWSNLRAKLTIVCVSCERRTLRQAVQAMMWLVANQRENEID
jgi:hypothetical protein